MYRLYKCAFLTVDLPYFIFFGVIYRPIYIILYVLLYIYIYILYLLYIYIRIYIYYTRIYIYTNFHLHTNYVSYEIHEIRCHSMFDAALLCRNFKSSYLLQQNVELTIIRGGDDHSGSIELRFYRNHYLFWYIISMLNYRFLYMNYCY